MAYIINNTRGNLVATVADGTIDNTTIPVALVGRGVTEYGLIENENYVYLLENFCNPVAPPNPMQGQLWFDSTNNVLTVRSIANTWINLASESYVQDQKASPAFTGVPTAPTPTAGTNNTQIATTAFVGTAITNYSATAGGTYAPINSPTFTGIPAAPTVSTTDNSTKLATTAFVQAQKVDTALTGTPTAPTATTTDNSTQIATTAFVQAQKVDTALTGLATSTTPGAADNSTRIATTAFVQAQKVDTVLTGTPTAPTTGLSDNSTKIATTAFVQAQKSSPTFTGTPQAPTAPFGTSNTQIATTAFVAAAVDPINGALGTMSTQNANSVTITGGSISGLTTALPITAGGTGATNAAAARASLGIPAFPLDIANGGTGATNAAAARAALGLGSGATTNLGTMGTQNADAVAITGGSITGITDLAIQDGGTGASTATQARVNLGLGNLALQANNSVLITGGQIYGLDPALPVASGGTGVTSYAALKTALGLGSGATTNTGTMALQNASAVAITGGSISGVSLTNLTAPLSVTSGGTGVTSYAALKAALDLSSGASTSVGSMATQNADAVTITGGSISGLTTALPIASGGTGSTSASGARTALGLGSAALVSVPISITNGGTGATSAAAALSALGGVPTSVGVLAGPGLSGGGSLSGSVTLSIASGSNGFGTRYVSTGSPSGGSNGDIWYRV